jgi:hypothetical protein
VEYNQERPHTSLGKLTPEEFARGASKFGLLPPKLAKINPNSFYAVKQPAELQL